MQYILKIIKNVISILLFVFCCTNVKAQINLVPNYSFEDSVKCPNDTILNPLPKPWYIPSKINGGQYLNECSTILDFSVPYNSLNPIRFQFARTGKGYAIISTLYDGFSPNTRRTLQVKLKDSLKYAHCYYSEFWVSLDNAAKFGTNNISMGFTNSAHYVDTLQNIYGILDIQPQITSFGNPIIIDTLNWIKISGIYKAQGGELYLSIGNFKKDINTSYQVINSSSISDASYYVDDVSVTPLDSFCLKADAGRDTIIKVGDSVFIGSYTNGIDTIKWYNSSGQLIDSSRPGFWFKPTTTGTSFFVLQQTVNGCFSSDTVYINAILPLNFISYNLVPSLRGTKQSVQNIWQTANEINVSHYNIQRSTNAKDFTTIGTIKANNKTSNEYNFTDDKLPTTTDQLTLYYSIQSIDNDGKKQYSQTKTLNLKSQTLNISIYPNPANNNVNVLANESIKEIKIINQLGQILQHQTPNAKLSTINCKLLTKGVYIVQAVLSNGTIQNQKLIIQ